MSKPALGPSAFNLLEEIQGNNNREWYLAHKKEWEKELRGPFADILDTASEELQASPLPYSGGSHTMFRQNRDIRFSRDKSPYQTHVSGLLTRSGTKDERNGVIYLQVDAFGGFMAAGFYMLQPKELAPIRDRIIAKPEAFADMTAKLASAGLELSSEYSLTAMPRGYEAHADSPLAEALKLKSFIVRQNLSREDWTGGRIVGRLASFTIAATPLFRYMAA